uniref:Uncharacterized protein n=1 Tax=Panagrolaimus davidi TaxID=227884 RepID=A0A914QYH3_9BILA
MNSANIAQVKENEKRKTVLSMEQKDRDQETKELANEAAKAAANRDKAKEIYHEQIQSNKAIFSVLATTAAEGVRDYVNGVGTKEALNLASKALGENGLAQIFAKEKESSPDISTKELALLQTLDIGSVASLKTPEAIASKIVYLKEFEKNTFSTPEGVSIKRKVTEFREKLESHGTDENLDSSLQGIKDSISGSINVYLKSLQERQMQQSKTKEAELSLHQQIFKSDAEKTQASQRVYEKEIENAEKIRKELSEKKDKLREIIIELQNITVSTDDLTGCIKFIEKVLGHLGQIEENWGNLVKFFDQIHTQIEHKLHKHVEEFGQHVEINYSQEFMLESAIKATAFIIQVLNCAEIYNATSQKLIMPVIRGINNQLNLTPEKAKVKQSEAHVKLNEAERNLEMLIESKKQGFNDRVSEQIKEFITKIQKAVQQSRNIGN